MGKGDREVMYVVTIILFAFIAIWYGAHGELSKALIMVIGMILLVALHEVRE